MSGRQNDDGAVGLLRTLADFRFELRQFLYFSECAAVEVGLQPQQHQLLLQVAGAPEGATVTIAYAAERLSLRHNSVVELVDRSEREGLLIRAADPADARRAILRATAKGERVLRRLAVDHARELDELAPRLAKAMRRIGTHAGTAVHKTNAGVSPLRAPSPQRASSPGTPISRSGRDDGFEESRDGGFAGGGA